MINNHIENCNMDDIKSLSAEEMSLSVINRSSKYIQASNTNKIFRNIIHKQYKDAPYKTKEEIKLVNNVLKIAKNTDLLGINKENKPSDIQLSIINQIQQSIKKDLFRD